MDPATAVTSAITLIKTCTAITSFVSNFIHATGADGIQALQQDVTSLSTRLTVVQRTCAQASGDSPSLTIEEHVLEWIVEVLKRCGVLLTDLNRLLDDFRSYDDRKLGRIQLRIKQVLCSDHVHRVQDQIAKYEHDLHFYMTLVNGYA